MKDCMAKHIGREYLIGYSAADVPEVLEGDGPAGYMECHVYDAEKRKVILDSFNFVALKSGSWCGDATYTSSGYDVLTALQNYSMAAFFAETGCDHDQPRKFSEVQALFSDSMMKTLPGAVISEYYDLVAVNDSDTITLSTDFENLQAQLSKLDRDHLVETFASPSFYPNPECESLTSFHIPERAEGVDGLIKHGARDGVHVGKLVAAPSQFEHPQNVYDSKGNKVSGIKFRNIRDSYPFNMPAEYVKKHEPNNEDVDAAMPVRASSAGALCVMIAMALFLVL